MITAQPAQTSTKRTVNGMRASATTDGTPPTEYPPAVTLTLTHTVDTDTWRHTRCDTQARPELNGCFGMAGAFDETDGRYQVVCDDGTAVKWALEFLFYFLPTVSKTI